MTPHTGPGDVPAWTLMLFLAYYIGERFWELRVSARHLQALKARGAVEYGRSHFPWIVT
jgi:isoprenylcysteine carboxyl methyltransferase (ICMT) family protein YpbQ